MTFQDFFWYVMSIIFMDIADILKIILSSFQISPYNPISYLDLFNFFVKVNTVTPVMDNILSGLPQRNKQFIVYSELIEIYKTKPQYFNLINQLKNEFMEFIGNDFCNTINERILKINDIKSYQDEHGKYPPEPCSYKLKNILLKTPPKFRYDYSMSLSLLPSTMDKLCRCYCAKYMVNCTVRRSSLQPLRTSKFTETAKLTNLLEHKRRKTTVDNDNVSIPRSRRSMLNHSFIEVISNTSDKNIPHTAHTNKASIVPL